MKEFQTSRNGYNKDEVKAYIMELENKLEDKEQTIAQKNKQLEEYIKTEKEMKEKESNISIALTSAVEKAKQIENSSHNVYKLKIEELEILYARWEKVLNELVDKYPKLEQIDNVKKLMKEFREAIKLSIKEDFRFNNISTQVSQDNDPMRVLLSKMNSSLDKQINTKKQVKTVTHKRNQIGKDMQTKQSELNKMEEKSTMIKPIYNSRIEQGEKFETLVDKFLTESADTDSAYATTLTTKTNPILSKGSNGFDLKEAVNPKEDLEEIMKSFDFFNGN